MTCLEIKAAAAKRLCQVRADNEPTLDLLVEAGNHYREEPHDIDRIGRLQDAAHRLNEESRRTSLHELSLLTLIYNSLRDLKDHQRPVALGIVVGWYWHLHVTPCDAPVLKAAVQAVRRWLWVTFYPEIREVVTGTTAAIEQDSRPSRPAKGPVLEIEGIPYEESDDAPK